MQFLASLISYDLEQQESILHSYLVPSQITTVVLVASTVSVANTPRCYFVQSGNEVRELPIFPSHD